MRDFKFDLRETENYYLQSLRKYQTRNPNWVFFTDYYP
jgi:hypothetical protein